MDEYVLVLIGHIKYMCVSLCVYVCIKWVVLMLLNRAQTSNPHLSAGVHPKIPSGCLKLRVLSLYKLFFLYVCTYDKG